MAGNGFKYVISTEVNLSPASINKLVRDIRGLDQQIQKSLSVNVNARLNNTAIKSIQRQIGDTKATLSVGLKLDRSSLAVFKRDIDTIVRNARREIEVSLTATNRAQQASAIQQPLSRPIVQQPNAISNPPLPRNAPTRITNSPELAARRQAEANYRDARADYYRALSERVRAQSERVQFNQASRTPVGSARNLPANHPARVAYDQQQMVVKQQKAIANTPIGSAQRLPSNHPVAEIIRANQELEKSNSLFDRMLTNSSRHFAFHIGIVMGFYKIQEAIVASVRNMKDFEAEFLKIQNLTSQRNADASEVAKKSVTPFSNSEAEKNIFEIGKRYGRDPIKDIMPVYTDLLRRNKIVSSDKDAKSLTQLIVRTVINSHGNQATPAEFKETSMDMENIFQQMIPYWKKKNPKANTTREASRFVDRLAMTGQEGGQIDKTLEALSSDILPLVTEGNTGLTLDFMTSFLASAQKYSEGNVGGKELATATRVLFTNLTKQNGTGANQINRLLGIQNQPTTSLREKLGLIHKRFEDSKGNPDTALTNELFNGFEGFNTSLFSEGEKQNLALSSASSGGGGGSSRASQNMNLLKALDDAYKLSLKEPTTGIAEKNATKSGENLSGLLGKLNASFQEMSITLGATGLLDSIKMFVKMTTGLVDVISGVLQPFALLHTAFHNLNADMADILSTIVTGGLLIKGASMAKNALFGGTAAKIASTAIGVGGGATIASTAAKTSTWWTKGASVGENGLGLLGLGMFAKGGVKNVANGEKVAGAFSGLLPILSKFGLLLARLSVWGAIAGVVFAGYKAMSNQHISQMTTRATKLTDSLSSGSNVVANQSMGADVLKSSFAKLIDIKNDPSLDTTAKHEQFNQAKKFIQDTYKVKVGSLNGSDSALKISTLGDTNDLTTNTFNLDKKGLENLGTLLDSITNKVSVGEEAYKKLNVQFVDQFKLMSDIKRLSDTIDYRKTYNQLANSLNDIRFTGSKDSASYLSNGMKISENTIGGLGGDYQTIADQRGRLANQTLLNQARVDSYSQILDPKVVEEITSSFQSFKTNNQLGNFLTKYQTNNLNDKSSVDKFNLAQTLFNSNADIENTQKLEETHQKVIETITTEVNKYQELYAQYLNAASGVTLFDASLKSLNAELSNAKTAYAMAIGDDAKIGTASGQFGVMAKQARVYSAELSGVRGTIEYLRAANPSEDFSFGTLNNPSEKGLSASQQGMKQLLDKQNELSQNYNSSVEALRQQSDTMVDLVMNTAKYKSIWDSVQSRIELSKQLYGQIRDIELGSVISRGMGNFNQRLQGSAFDAGGFSSQGATQRRDAYSQAYEQTQKAIATYGDDAQKLKEALSQISGSLGDQLKAAFIDPLKDIIGTNFTEASKTQLQASNVFAESITTLQKILDADAERAGIKMPTPESAGTSSYGGYYNPSNGTSGANSYGGYYSPSGTSSPSPSPSPTPATGKYSDFINKASATYGVDPNLIKAVIQQESGFNQTGKNGKTLSSSAGALGLMQLMPGTAAGLGVDAHDPEQNIMGGTKYLAGLLKQFNGDVTKTLIGYNAGPGNVKNVLSSGAGSWKEPKDYVNKVTGNYAKFSGGNPPATPTFNGTGVDEIGVPSVTNKGQEAQIQNQNAIQKILAESSKLQIGAIGEQVNSLLSNGIEFNFNKSVRDASTKSSISGMWTEQQTGYYDAVHQARSSVKEKQFENQATLDSYRGIVSSGGYTDSSYNANTGQFETKFVELTPQLLLAYKNNITKLEENTNSLNALEENYKKMGYWDPRDNTTEATKQIGNVLDSLKSQLGTSAVGDKKWYDDLQSLNNMFANYFTLNKKVAVSQEAFDNTGFGYQNLGKLKQLKFDQDVKILFDQMQGVAGELGKFAEGTNKWHVILSDAVALQEKLVGLENKKTEEAKRYFELTNKSVSPYINARAYTQSRDFNLSSRNYSSAKDNYKNNQGNMDANEQLVNFQVISESHDKMLQQMNDYRNAVVGAFKAGVMSLQEYLLKLNNLRDMNNEIKQQAVDMTASMQDGFHNALSGALKSGMQGSFTGQQEFVSGIKESLASSVSGQMSNIVLQQSGLQDVMNGLISSMVGSMTTGTANGSVNAFNTTDFGKKINDALNPFLPLIQQITDSTKGIFTVLKDQVFNAPSGFKIDSYLYDGAKAKGAGDLGWWQTSGGQNEAGSPIPPKSGTGKPIVLPPMEHVPTGVPTIVTKPIEYIGNGGSLNSPIAAPEPVAPPVIWNPVKEAIQRIIQMQQGFDYSTSVVGSAGNSSAHSEADRMRALIASIPGTQDIMKQIGNGLTPESMGIADLQKLLKDQKLGQFDVVKNTDNTNSNLNTANSILTGIQGGIGAVASNIAGLKTTQPQTQPPAIPSFTVPGGTIRNDYTDAGGTHGVFIPNGSSGGGSSSGSSSGSSGSSSNSSSGSSSGSSGSSSNPNTSVIWVPGIGNVETFKGAKVPPGGHIVRYHTGGLAGIMNFANANGLKSNEVKTIMEHGEIALQPRQFSSLAQNFMEMGATNGFSGGGYGRDSNVNVNVDVSGTGSSDGGLSGLIEVAVETAVQQFYRRNRLDDLRNKGVTNR